MSSLLSTALLALQPVAFFPSTVFFKTRRSPGDGVLVSARGVEHPLRAWPDRVLAERFLAQNHDAQLKALRMEVSRRCSSECTDELAWFCQFLASTADHRLWEHGAAVSGACEEHLSVALRQKAAEFPIPEVPAPSFCWLGRLWLLAEKAAVRREVHVRLERTTFGLTGDFLPLGSLVREWQANLTSHTARAAEELTRDTVSREDSNELREAREAVATRGFVARGDLLFIAGKPPYMAHILPAHRNLTLGRTSSRDLAVGTPLTLPPKVGTPVAFQCKGGKWTRLQLPKGICLGAMPSVQPLAGSTPGAAVVAWLRWAAIRISQNGIFHEHDLRDPK